MMDRIFGIRGERVGWGGNSSRALDNHLLFQSYVFTIVECWGILGIFDKCRTAPVLGGIRRAESAQ